MMSTLALLAGGYATRLYPATQTTAKAMLEVAGKPFIAHQLDRFKKSGIAKVVICSGHLGQQIEDFIGSGRAFGLSVAFSNDGEKLLGTGGAIKKALPLLGDIFFVMYGDSYLDIDFGDVRDHFLSHDKKGLMTVFKNANKWDKSNTVFQDGKIIAYNKEKPSPDMKYIDYGLGLLRKTAFEKIGQREVFDLVDLYQSLIAEGEMLGFEAEKRFYEIGSAAGLAETERYLSRLSHQRGK